MPGRRAGLHEPLLHRLAALNAAPEEARSLLIVINGAAALIKHQQAAAESLEHRALAHLAPRKGCLGLSQQRDFLAGLLKLGLR